MIFTRPLIALLTILLFSTCDSGPKVIPVTEDSNSTSGSTGVFSDNESEDAHEGHNHPTGTAQSKDVHTVIVKEVLPTDKYVYLFVEEEGDEFWLATSKVDVTVGESYFYKQGLLKTNFHSKEYDRTFDTIYLVSQVVPVNHGNNAAPEMNNGASVKSEPNTIAEAAREINVEGSVKIADLVGNPKKYAGQEIQLSGVVTKVNPNIMERNWIHLKDGSLDDYDLVITSNQAIPEGHTVTMKGVVSLNKDFGAGYQYAIIVEEGLLVR
jgi:hypothetical protein